MKRHVALAAGVLGLHVVLLVHASLRDSPTRNEGLQLVAGISHYEVGRFELNRICPPLSRLVAALPALVDQPTVGFEFYDLPGERHVFRHTGAFLAANGERVLWYCALGRLACVPFSLLAGVLCFRWSRELFGPRAALLACTLWAFTPLVLANGHVITPAMSAAVTLAWNVYLFKHWLANGRWSWAMAAAAALGLNLLCQFAALICFLAWPGAWMVRSIYERRQARQVITQAAQLAVILGGALYVLNAGYGFAGTFTSVGDYRFVSHALSGAPIPEVDPNLHELKTGNLLATDTFAHIPLPLPKDWLLGCDRRRFDQERPIWVYTQGRWTADIPVTHLAYACLLKTPLAWFGLLGISLLVTASTASRTENMFLVAPIVLVVLLASYGASVVAMGIEELLPAVPFAVVWTSRLAVDWRQRTRVFRATTIVLVTWLIASSLFVFPHSISYFNELAGGPRNGHRYLGGSEFDTNVDCGQDLFYLRDWAARHPEGRLATVLGNAFAHYDDPVVPGIAQNTETQNATLIAVSVNHLHARDGKYDGFKWKTPLARCGYSIHVYEIDE